MSKRINGYLFPRPGTKKARILNDLMNGYTMTPMKAMAYGTHRLAAIIHELRNLNGFTIAATERHDGAGTLYTEYRMPEGARLDAVAYNRRAA
jgi:hypothetical protein